jgi:alpha-glucosidase (family GH31 glycosyl hydrolase)
MKSIEGPQWIETEADLDSVPIYFRGGHAVAFGPEITYADEKPQGPLNIRAFPDKEGRARMIMETEIGRATLELEMKDGAARAKVSGLSCEYAIEVPGLDAKQIIISGQEKFKT